MILNNMYVIYIKQVYICIDAIAGIDYFLIDMCNVVNYDLFIMQDTRLMSIEEIYPAISTIDTVFGCTFTSRTFIIKVHQIHLYYYYCYFLYTGCLTL